MENPVVTSVTVVALSTSSNTSRCFVIKWEVTVSQIIEKN